MKRRSTVLALVIATGLMLGGGTAWAGTIYKGYDTTVVGIGGFGYTSYQTKSTSSASGDLDSEYVGGVYVVSARMQNKSEVGGTYTGYVVNDGTTHSLANSFTASTSVRVQFKNRPQTLVGVQVSGDWRSN